MHTQEMTYQVDDQNFIAYVAYDETIEGARPAVMVAHAFEGRTQAMCQHAENLSKQGYVGVAIDLYGDAELGANLDECMALLMPCFQDRALLRARVVAAYEATQNIAMVDADNIAILGFCFGGLCALDLVRSGAAIKGAVSVHGILAAPENLPNEPMSAKVLVLHGYQDPQVPAESIAAFIKEMSDAQLDWQLHYFGTAKHAFTDPAAAQIGPAEMGRVYDQLANDRSFAMIEQFLQEVFSE